MPHSAEFEQCPKTYRLQLNKCNDKPETCHADHEAHQLLHRRMPSNKDRALKPINTPHTSMPRRGAHEFGNWICVHIQLRT